MLPQPWAAVRAGKVGGCSRNRLCRAIRSDGSSRRYLARRRRAFGREIGLLLRQVLDLRGSSGRGSEQLGASSVNGYVMLSLRRDNVRRSAQAH